MDFGESFGVFSWLGIGGLGAGKLASFGPKGRVVLIYGRITTDPGKTGVDKCSCLF